MSMRDDTPVAGLTVVQLGEFGLIDRLARILSGSRDPLRPELDGAIGIGDDAALWDPRPGFREVLTTDALIEDIHFRHSTTSWHDLGWKALAENVSDIAAMGARPTRAFVTLGLRPETRVADLEALYEGMREHAATYHFEIAGGDTVSSPVTMLSVTVVGELQGDGLRRAAGRPGDALIVTGPLGGSAGGLALLERGSAPADNADVAALIRAHRRPNPRVQEGWIMAQRGVRCGMDLSDGLLGDAGKLAYASGLSAVIGFKQIPLAPALVRHFGEQAAGSMALAGGEDYELLVATSTPAAIQRLLSHAGFPMPTVVGRLVEGAPGQVSIVDEDGQPITPPRSSWDHFRSAGPNP